MALVKITLESSAGGEGVPEASLGARSEEECQDRVLVSGARRSARS